MQATEVMGEIRPRLTTAFGRRLRGVIFYGSRARGNAAPDSDLDLMVLLEGPVRLGRDLDAIVHALQPLQMELDCAIHTMPVDIRDFEAQQFGIYRKVQEEGVRL